MEVVDSAIADTEKVAPSITMYTAVGFILGLILSVVVIIIIVLMDNTVHDEEYVIKTYDYPILAKIPDLLEMGDKKYGKYSKYSKYGYYYKSSTYGNNDTVEGGQENG